MIKSGLLCHAAVSVAFASPNGKGCHHASCRISRVVICKLHDAQIRFTPWFCRNPRKCVERRLRVVAWYDTGLG